ncbi:MAG: GGDEF domain-containing protein, partial [Janthinobacterium lividum]
MATKTESMLTERPTEIALEAMRLLAKRREAPTPQAYQLAYEEIARRMQVGEVSFVAHVAAVAAAAAGQASAGRARSPGAVPVAPLALAPEAVPAPAPIETPADAADARPIQPANGAESGSAPALLRQNTLLRDLLMRTLTLAVAPMLAASPELAAQAEALGQEVRNGGDDALDDAATRLRQLCFKIGMRSTDMAEQQELLLRLFRLLLDNVSQLLDDDSWMQGQMAATNALLAGPLSYRALEEASRSLKEVVYKQSILKKGMSDA